MSERFVTHSEAETIELGKKMAERFIAGDVVALFGDLGSGKTHLTKGICLGAGIREHVTSPTFIIVNEHLDGKIPVYHFDFYRFRTPGELDEIGFDEYVCAGGICVLEWADLIGARLPLPCYALRLSLGESPMERIIELEYRER